MKTYIHCLGWLLWRELFIEFRRKDSILAMLLFSIGIIFLFHFSFPADMEKEPFAAGIIWIAIALAGTFSLNRSMAIDLEDAHLDALLLAPVDRSVFFLAKLLGNTLFMGAMALFLFPIAWLFLDIHLFDFSFLIVSSLGIAGYSIVGSLLAGMSMQTRLRDTLLSVLLFPILIPLLVAAVKASTGIFLQTSWQSVLPWVQFMLVYDAVFFAIGLMVYPVIVEG